VEQRLEAVADQAAPNFYLKEKKMRHQIRRNLAIFTLLAACGQLCAQSRIHPFEQPPRLKETSQPGPLLTTFSIKPSGPQRCDPQGSLSRDGNIVSAKLNFVRADFTINNPDDANNPSKEDPVTLRSYGGCKSGPLIEVLPGNTLRVDLINGLSTKDPTCPGNPPGGAECFNTTNLHTHGLHVSPAGNSDNVLLNIAPQTEFPYEINIPSDHPAGTFWYHAHRHGSTAVQVASGASGILIVRGNRQYTPPTPQNPRPIADIDTILHDARGVPMDEKFFLFQQIAYACFNNDPKLPGGLWQQIYTTAGMYDASSKGQDPKSPANAPWTCPAPAPGKFVSRGAVENFNLQLDSATIWDTNGRFTSVNGIVQPTITIPAGEIQRWRFVHAGIHDTINLQVVPAASPAGSSNLIEASALTGNRQQQQVDVARSCPATPQSLIPQFEIASDGLTRIKMRTLGGKSESGSIGSNYLQPGYRSDVLIVFPEDGYYCLLNQAAPAAERATNGGRGQGRGGQGPSEQQLLAYIHVKGGHRVSGDLETFVRQALYAGNPKLPNPVRRGLQNGDLTPWAPFVHLPPAPPANLQKADFAINFPLFQINGKSYDPDVVNVTRQVNTSDDWLLTSQGEPHIFHVHVNPFEVIDVTQAGPDGKQESIFDANGNCKATMGPAPQGLVNQYCSMYHVFRDTLFVENNYQIHIRTRYDRYIGEFVIHCHILDHEDAGMMLNIQIVPDLKAPGNGVGMSGMKHTH
jgi:FtsP/CotA-like multicopper oxidase with cupredoxin domain